jgi:D-alanyl-D-alanine carboxypeptidase
VVTACGGGPGGTSTTGSASAAPSPNQSALFPAAGLGTLPAKTAGALQAAVSQYPSAHSLVGVSAAVVTSAGSWSGVAGTDGQGSALSTDSAFAVASVTKTFVAAELLNLARRGKVDLDAPVTNYVDVPFDTGGATVLQLASMKSGFPALPNAVVMTAAARDPSRIWALSDVVELAKDRRRSGTVGGPAVYNGVNYNVLAQVVEKVTGSSLASAIRTDLLQPAGLERIWIQAAEKPVPPLAYPADTPIRGLVDVDSGYLPSLSAASSWVGGAGAAADAPTLARWAYLLYSGRIIAPDLVTAMTAGDPDGEFGYGIGTMTANMDGTKVVGHAGSFNQYTSVMYVWSSPAAAASIVVLVPQSGGMSDDTRQDLAFLLYQMVRNSL